jgi:hypothetical protein
VVFAGYGITAPEYGYDDYAGLDVEGKVVFVLRHEPNEDDPESVFDGAEHSRHAYFTTKAENAAAHGAVGMILVTDPLHHEETETVPAMRRLSLDPDIESHSGPMQADVPNDFVAVHVSQGFGAAMAQKLGGDLSEMQRALDAGRQPARLGLSWAPTEVSVAALDGPRRIPARNVAGYLPGPEHGEEGERDLVLIGAHHDHIGTVRWTDEQSREPSEDSESSAGGRTADVGTRPDGAAETGAGTSGAGTAGSAADDSSPPESSPPPDGRIDKIFNGADDNASGTAGVLELAERFATSGEPPTGGMIFVTFSAEEWGLFGARASIEKKLLPTDQISHMVNLDMIGRNPEEAVRVYGATEAEIPVREAARMVGVEIRTAEHSRRSASDHTVFVRAGIDAIFFHTGLHGDYHGVDDESERLDYDHMRNVAELVAETVERLPRLQ